MSKEIWKDIPGWEGYYQASNLGRIRSLDRIVTHSLGGDKMLKSMIMKQRLFKCGYYYVGLQKEGKTQKMCRVHRLIAKAFHPNPQNKPEVNHDDGNKLNNCEWNLEWATRKENAIHSHATGLQKPSEKQRKSAFDLCKKRTGFNNPVAKRIIDISTNQVYASTISAAQENNLNEGTLRRYLKGYSPNKTNLRYA
jgi:hypothetical protein